jgi:hypothetical protein
MPICSSVFSTLFCSSFKVFGLDPAVPLLGIHLKECMSRHLHTSVYSALLAITKLQKHPRCPTTDEWIKKIWYVYSVEYYSTIKKNEMFCSQDRTRKQYVE